MTPAVFPGLSLDDAEREIHAHIFSRTPEQDHDAKLRRVAEALSQLGNPHERLRVVHVTGTNGKTSTSRMIESLLRASGLRTGLFTSPHLTSLRERIMIGGAPMPQEALVRLWQRVAPAVHAVDSASIQAGGPRMSFFEVLTVLGLVAYADANVDVAVIEVGIGGQRDATNVVTGEVAVLTPMAEDHADYFTGGLPGIAAEKSGIIKHGATVVSAVQDDVAAHVISAHAAVRSASVFWEGGHMSVDDRRVVAGGQVVTLRTAAFTYVDAFVPLHGEFQAQNALVALAACEVFLGQGIPRSLELPAVAQGFAAATSPGRLEVLAQHPTILVDAAHNPHGVDALVGALGETFAFDSVVGVVAVLADKDSDGILVGLEPVMDHLVITRTESVRAMEVAELAAAAREVFGAARVSEAEDVPTAMRLAIQMATTRTGDRNGVVVAGSITLVGEARRHVQSAADALGAADVENATDVPEAAATDALMRGRVEPRGTSDTAGASETESQPA
ncbi:bifunctional folylpolyglutamate synthase/dihydrofolate synthase [Demequina aurantiaca]|uniref:bifunctional folylpolyglutamate synthase/dihydrofolate synthase n=1 Tax=Demequina aurantiaca TaxID=676200 RepID=UPI0007853489|nr:folylpolyglutamate synthase/dihydrofolate synthase family protein [Demequina aurantiaca]